MSLVSTWADLRASSSLGLEMEVMMTEGSGQMDVNLRFFEMGISTAGTFKREERRGMVV